jgi:hypothetical protein
MFTQKCIYCLEEKELSLFNREHVLPEAFGKFKNNLPRLRCVCCCCNKYFGEHIELIFYRGGLEATYRLQKGLKAPHEVSKLHRDRLSFTVGELGDWYAVRIEWLVEEDNLVFIPFPQVGFVRKGQSQWIYITESELADPSKLLPDDLDSKTGIKLLAPSKAVEECLLALLAAKGILVQKPRKLSPPPLEERGLLVDHHFSIDWITRRAVAKIAFNYLACVAGSEFVLRSEFDPMRSFIRYGSLHNYPIIRVSSRPILFDDLPVQRQTDGHLLTLDWPGSRDCVIGKVSFFNTLTYEILLTRRCSAIWRVVRKGHYFDITEKRVIPLSDLSLIFLPRHIKQGLAHAASLARPRVILL